MMSRYEPTAKKIYCHYPGNAWGNTRHCCIDMEASVLWLVTPGYQHSTGTSVAHNCHSFPALTSFEQLLEFGHQIAAE
jgi:hypothetical protein